MSHLGLYGTVTGLHAVLRGARDMIGGCPTLIYGDVDRLIVGIIGRGHLQYVVSNLLWTLAARVMPHVWMRVRAMRGGRR